MTKRILKQIHIDEISAVTRGANKHARMVLMKRDDSPTGFDSFQDAIDAIRRAEGCSRTDALSAAARSYPDLLRKQQDDSDKQIAKAAAEAAPRPVVKAVLNFWDTVHDIMKRDGISKPLAMSRARTEFPAVFSAYEEA